ncbi:MAG: hypothetical protein R2709_14345 [Marmoricola sp.]
MNQLLGIEVAFSTIAVEVMAQTFVALPLVISGGHDEVGRAAL